MTQNLSGGRDFLFAGNWGYNGPQEKKISKAIEALSCVFIALCFGIFVDCNSHIMKALHWVGWGLAPLGSGLAEGRRCRQLARETPGQASNPPPPPHCIHGHMPRAQVCFPWAVPCSVTAIKRRSSVHMAPVSARSPARTQIFSVMSGRWCNQVVQPGDQVVETWPRGPIMIAGTRSGTTVSL